MLYEAFLLDSARRSVGFVAQRNAPRSEPLDDLDWSNIDAARAALCGVAERWPVFPIPATSSRPGPAVRADSSHTTCIYTPAGVCMALRQIHHRGHLAPGDMDVLHAALRLIEGMAT